MGAEGFGSQSDSKGGSSGSGERRLSKMRNTISELTKNRKPTDRRQILEIGDEKMKLKEMRKVSEEVARGENHVELFPTIVKNVVAKSVEVSATTAEDRTRLAPLALPRAGSTTPCHHSRHPKAQPHLLNHTPPDRRVAEVGQHVALVPARCPDATATVFCSRSNPRLRAFRAAPKTGVPVRRPVR